MKLFLLTLTALITGMLMACSSTPKSESGVVFDDPYKFEKGVLYKYIKSVATASEGCVTDS